MGVAAIYLNLVAIQSTPSIYFDQKDPFAFRTTFVRFPPPEYAMSFPSPFHPLTVIYSQLCVRGAPWSVAYRLHGQRFGAFSWRPVLRPFQEDDKFRLDPTQNYSPGRRCDRVSSVYHLTLGKCPWHLPACDQPPWLCHARIPSTTSTPAHTQPTIAMTNCKHALTVTNSSAFYT